MDGAVVRAWFAGTEVPARWLGSAVAVAVCLTVALNLLVGGVVDPVPDLLHPATPSSLRAALGALDPAERAAYVRFAFLDVLYPLAYATALSGALAKLRPDSFAGVVFAPVLAAGFDLTENAFMVALCLDLLPASEVVLWLASAANTLKWMFADLSLLAVAVFGLWRAVRRLTARA